MRDEDHYERSAASEDVDANRTQVAADELARETAMGDDEMMYADGREGDDAWLGVGLTTVLLVAGLVLFLFPEPATSAVGVLLMIAGVVTWAVTRLR